MATVRRWYIYLVCLVSLQAVTWAVIDLLRSLATVGSPPLLSVAFQLAVVIIGLPVFLIHWLLAQRAARDVDERASGVRRFYLYVTLASFAAPALGEVYGLIDTLLRRLLGFTEVSDFSVYGFTPLESVIRGLVALVVLGALWFYHQRVLAADVRTTELSDGAALLRRLYVMGFSAAGVGLTVASLISLLRWVLLRLGSPRLEFGEASVLSLVAPLATIVVALPLWLVFWGWAQRLFVGPSLFEHESALRKFYLYALVGVAVVTGVTNVTFIVAGLFRRLLDLPSQGDIREILPVIIGMGVLWVYHAAVLRDDAGRAVSAPRQAAVRRLYEYLVAAIGLTAFLIGLGGVFSVLFQSAASNGLGHGLREQLAWSAAALLVGLPVWLLPWRRAQLAAADPGATGVDERRSTLRRLYLYLFIFAATMTVLSSAVYLVYQLLSLLLGERFGSLFADLGQSLSFILIGVAVWVYHGLSIRGDNQRNRQGRASRLAAQRVAVVAGAEDPFSLALLAALRRALPELEPELIDPATPRNDEAHTALSARLAATGLIVGNWSVLAAVPAALEQAIRLSPARKLLVPARVDGYDWAGVDRWTEPALVGQVVHAVSRWADGEEIRPARQQSAASVAVIIAAVLLGLQVVIPLVSYGLSWMGSF